MSKKVLGWLVGLVVVVSVLGAGSLLERARAFAPEEVLLGGLVGTEANTAVLRGSVLENGRTLLFLDLVDGPSHYAEPVGEVGVVEAVLLAGCGHTVLVAVQADGQVSRWTGETATAWPCDAPRAVFVPVVTK